MSHEESRPCRSCDEMTPLKAYMRQNGHCYDCHVELSTGRITKAVSEHSVHFFGGSFGPVKDADSGGPWGDNAIQYLEDPDRD